jgi:hypothetical protein
MTVLHTVRVRMQRWGQTGWSVLLAVVLTTFVSGCGSSDDASPSGSPSASSSPHPDDQGSPSTKQSRVPDPLAPATIKPVVRNGKRPVPRIKAATQPFDGSVKYSDGVQLRVTDVRQGRVTDSGPGIVRGPVTSFYVEMTNGSDSSINLNQVVPTVVYGSPKRLSSPVYLPTNGQDFRGVLKPGESTTAVYRFEIPKASLGKVTFMLDFDGTHAAATFAGAAR